MDRRRRLRSKRNKRVFFYLIVILLPIYFATRPQKQTEIVSPIVATSPTVIAQQKIQKPLFSFLSKSKKPDDLKSAVKTLADSLWKNYSILVIDMNSNFSMALNENTIYSAASVNKIPILATLYHNASEGNIDMTNTITLQWKDIQDYGTGSIRYDAPGSVYTIKTLATLMIKKSDNTAAYILANYTLSLPSIQTYIESLGLTQTNMVDNTTSNKDMAILFKKIFNGEIANTALTQEMIGLMKDTDFEDRLPAKLPENAVVYHKIGTGIGAVHDVGVVESATHKYYIGIFTENIIDEEKTSEEVAEMSRAVYEFMNN